MNETEFKQFLATRPKAFFDANPGLCAPERKPDRVPALDGEAPGKTEGDARIIVGIILYRVRLLDTENAYTATKSLTDCLCQVGLLPGDSDKEIQLTVTQEKVSHFYEQRTQVQVVYPV